MGPTGPTARHEKVHEKKGGCQVQQVSEWDGESPPSLFSQRGCGGKEERRNQLKRGCRYGEEDPVAAPRPAAPAREAAVGQRSTEEAPTLPLYMPGSEPSSQYISRASRRKFRNLAPRAPPDASAPEAGRMYSA